MSNGKKPIFEHLFDLHKKDIELDDSVSNE